MAFQWETNWIFSVKPERKWNATFRGHCERTMSGSLFPWFVLRGLAKIMTFCFTWVTTIINHDNICLFSCGTYSCPGFSLWDELAILLHKEQIVTYISEPHPWHACLFKKTPKEVTNKNEEKSFNRHEKIECSTMGKISAGHKAVRLSTSPDKVIFALTGPWLQTYPNTNALTVRKKGVKIGSNLSWHKSFIHSKTDYTLVNCIESTTHLATWLIIGAKLVGPATATHRAESFKRSDSPEINKLTNNNKKK